MPGLVNFGSFAIHVAPGIVLIIVVMFFFLKYLYRDKLRRQPNTKRLKEIAIWKLTVEKIRGYEGEEEKQIRRKLEDHVRQLVRSPLIVSRVVSCRVACHADTCSFGAKGNGRASPQADDGEPGRDGAEGRRQ